MNDTQPNFAKKLAPRGSVDHMEHAGFKARLMMAERLVGDRVHKLPPFRFFRLLLYRRHLKVGVERQEHMYAQYFRSGDCGLTLP